MSRLHIADPGAAPCEYVPDVVDLAGIPGHGRGRVTETDAAVDGVIAYLDERIAAVSGKFAERPSLLLSGGIDSMLLAAALSRNGIDCLAVTFTGDVEGRTDAEAARARQVCDHFGIEHGLVNLSTAELSDAAWIAGRTLGVSDPWEVLAAVVLTECDRYARERGATGPIFTGAGADSLFLGGSAFEPVSEEEWADAVRRRVGKNFTRERLIPDFYERLLMEPDRHIQVWQTRAAVELALTLAPAAVRGPDFGTDKRVLREAAVRLGLPSELVYHAKSPMQVSSGGVESLVRAARTWLLTRKGSSEYADPMTEPLEYTVARLWLERGLAGD